MTKLLQLIEQREELAKEIKLLQKDRKRLNNHIAVLKHRENQKKV